MAEQAPQVKNKGLLLVAVILGIVVVIIYNIHVSKIREDLQGEQVQLLRFTRSMEPGEKIEAKDIAKVDVRKITGQKLGTVVRYKSRNYVIGRKLRQRVNLDQWVEWSYVQGGGPGENKAEPLPGHVAVTTQLDPRMSPGPLCSPGDRVNVLAFLNIAEQPPKVYRVMRNIRVLATGPRAVEGISGQAERTHGRGVRTYRTIGLEIKESESKKFVDILVYSEGKIFLEVLPSTVGFDEKRDGIINPEEPALQTLLKTGPMSRVR